MLRPTQDKQLLREIADRYMIQCSSGEPFECPHLVDCPHEDKDICKWQEEKALELAQIFERRGYHVGLPESIEHALNSGNGTYHP